jgi:serine/threonine protein kinase
MSQARRPLPDAPGKTSLCDGAKVGRYTVEFLAVGGMSVVYKGRCGDQVVALKEVAIDNTVEVPLLMAEKALLERLNHPGVLRFVELLVQDGFYYLATEFIEGSPMARWIDSDERASDQDVVAWGAQLAGILQYLHSCNPPIIFRDLKPGNVLVTPDGQVRLIDFGIARLHKGDRQQDTSLFGSLQTASPEHFGMSETDIRSDVYTLGMTLYLLFTGGVVRKHGFAAPSLATLRPDLASYLIEAIDRSVRVDPDMRQQSMTEFRRELLASEQPDGAEELEALPGGAPKGEQNGAPKGEPNGEPKGEPNGEPGVDQNGEPNGEQKGEPKPESGSQADSEPQLQVTGQARVAKGLDPLARRPLSQRPGLLAALLLLGCLVLGLLLKGGQVVVAAKQLESQNFPADLFAAGSVGERNLVLLGEEIGLFEVSAAQQETADERAHTIAERLNRFYREFCPLCSRSKLEPGDVRVGSHHGSTVVFYAHQHGDGVPSYGPILLATVTQKQSKELGLPPRFIAGYWRDLLRDTVQLSRGQKSAFSALGKEVEQALQRAREGLKPGEAPIDNLRAVLRQLKASEVVKLEDLYLQIPDYAPQPDEFSNLPGYQPLRL